MEKKWWHHSVVYQIYPRSFYDSNNDGIGDLQGIIQKLDYIESLGADVIWLSPVYASPNDDNGYDIADYYQIMDEFGTMADMDELIAQAKQRNIKIVMDIVANHTSDEHQWFVEARKSKDNPYHDYYVWAKTPNNLRSIFSGSAWQYDEHLGEYYLHLFSKKQPDLNWTNPRVRQDIADMIIFWLEKGIGGFRFDVIDLIGKIPEQEITENGPKLHEYIKELNQKSFGRYDVLTVGETWGATIEIGEQYSNPKNNELSMIFQFEHILLDQQVDGEKWDLAPLDFIKLKQVLSKWQTELYGIGWNSLFWNNHDTPRAVSRFANDQQHRVEAAKLLATITHGMWGTPYIYQGEEIGMTNVRFDSLASYRDVETLNMYNERIKKGYSHETIMESIYTKGRDNARTPMQWNGSAYGGFSTTAPWINVNPNYETINVEQALADPNSIFNYYQQLIQLRKANDWVVYGTYRLILENDKNIFAYIRAYQEQEYLVYGNFSAQNVRFDIEELATVRREDIILSNYNETQLEQKMLQPFEAGIIKLVN
ncbi:glycoside hydrolase family 13 protein [Culicoidibacter larvae]|uniref:Alpha-glucosidase n=1 Tax=Culicoidibacter larvae TaxID=2579976 RepID=A0A5R8QE04_9FIRM|nr:alpha-glucosidase [Culicoidibacter larvae]